MLAKCEDQSTSMRTSVEQNRSRIGCHGVNDDVLECLHTIACGPNRMIWRKIQAPPNKPSGQCKGVFQRIYFSGRESGRVPRPTGLPG